MKKKIEFIKINSYFPLYSKNYSTKFQKYHDFFLKKRSKLQKLFRTHFMLCYSYYLFVRDYVKFFFILINSLFVFFNNDDVYGYSVLEGGC
jgi:hypothetical protein